jgi:hypothetical protein
MRRRLLDRLGLFGVRLSVELLVARRVESTGDVATALEARSGILELREVLAGQFASRATVLKARSTIATVRAMADLHGGPEGRALKAQVRDIENAAHELVEIRLLSQLRSLDLGLGEADSEARRILGGDGHDGHRRLGLPATASGDEIRSAAISCISRWRAFTADPVLSKEARDVADGVVRSCEALATSGR